MTPLRALCTLACLVLAGCGSERADEGQFARQLGNALKGASPLGGKAEVPDVPPALTPALLAQIESPVMVVRIEPPVQVAGLLPVARNGDTLTWATEDRGVTLSFTGGVLSATRGLGDDLMSVDSQELRTLLTEGRGGRAVRVHRYLDGEHQVVTEALQCEIRDAGPDEAVLPFETRPARLFVERCANLRRQIENRYWLDGGLVIQSKQWVGPGERHVRTRIAFPPATTR